MTHAYTLFSGGSFMKTNKIYGNSQGDGFALYMGLITVLFVMGGIGLAKVGGIVLLAALPAFVVMCALMALKMKKWDVMSDETADLPSKDLNVKVMTFPVPGVSDSKPNPAAAAWAPSKDSAATLPAPVEKPKSTVETNTHVA
jgi:predicted lipid-binding transport protein (Tim44 family)